VRLICGVFHLDGKPVAADLLGAMCAQMTAPGLAPRIRTWRERHVGLAVLDFAARTDRGDVLPLNAHWVLAADLRLDAPKALIAGASIEATDDDLFLSALQRWDSDAPLNVLGDYAFAAWNRPAQTLLCGRDAFGIRPFVYVYAPDRLFAFASLPRALHGTGLIAKKLNQRGLALRLIQAWDDDDTLFEGIRRLPAAHVLEVKADGFSLRRYWQLDAASAGTRRVAPEEAAAQTRALVEEAVRCRLPAEGPVAAHLSGGLDSSAISILAARTLRRQQRTLHAYSFLPRVGDCVSEISFVDAVRTQEPDIAWTPIAAPDLRHSLAGRMDTDYVLSIEPEIPENAVCADAAEHRVRLVLSGYGGDEGITFNGRGTLAEALLRGHWRYLAAEIAALRRTRGWHSDQTWRSEILPYLIPTWLISSYRRLRRRPGTLEQQLRPMLKQAVRSRLGDVDARTLRMGADARINRLRLLSSAHIAERSEHWAAIGARYGLAFAFPLLDRRVVEFAASLPSALFLRGGFKRRMFRDAMEGILPEAIRWRHNKLPPMPDSLTAAAEAVEAIARRLAEGKANPDAAALLDFDYLQRMLAAFPTATGLRTGNADPTPILIVMSALGIIAYVESNYDATTASAMRRPTG
jgi:asparagine synthase (glutamine-hydrolysing)